MSQAVHGGITGQLGQVRWPVLSGLMPPLADSYTPRTESGPDPADDLHPGETVVLVTADNAARALGGMGGTGKTQLAAAIAHTLWSRGAVDLVLWVTASGRDAVLTGYAQALGDVGLPDPYEGPEVAASHFLAWLAETPRPWLAVLDDLTDPAVLDGLWPWGPSGRVLVTTNRPDAALRAHSPRAVELGPFSDRESLAYLSTRLQADRDQWTGALDLAADLGFLPIALAQAGTLMAYTGIDCRDYRTRMAEWRQHLGAGNGTSPPAVAGTGALALEVADRLPPAGLARPMLALISMLDPNGIPGAVLTTPAACAYLSRFGAAASVDEVQARTAVHALGRLGLVTIDTTSAARTVRVHELVQAASRQSLSTPDCDAAALAAADALFQAWPPPQAVPAASGQALRDCTARLHQIAGVLLWNPECHPVLVRAGQCLDNAGLAGPAIAYWQSMIDIGRPTLGATHAHTILASDRLAAAYDAAGRHMDAIPVHERVLAERERELGPSHPDTLNARNSLARTYRAAGRGGDAVRLAERALADCERIQGLRHPDSLAARSELAQAYLSAGLRDEAIAVFEIALAGQKQALGPHHPDTLTARANLAHAYRAAGRPKQAISLFEETLADREKVQGADHPDTLAARGNLGSAYRAAGRLRDAIGAYKHALADRERVQGPDHADTRTARANLAAAYQQAGRVSEAVQQYEHTLADCDRMLGPAEAETLTTRISLASALYAGGRLMEGVAVLRRALSDAERYLGPDHPMTQTVRADLDAATRT